MTSVDGEPVALHDLGGTGPAVLLGHGNGLNAGMWAAVVPQLRDGGYHCYGIDLRGHGACRPVDPAYSVDRDHFADDVLACIGAVGPAVHYAGHSLGGAAGIYAALRRPELFRSLWLFEPVVLPDDLVHPTAGPSVLIEASRRRRMTFDSVDHAFERMATKPPFSTCAPVAVRAYLELGTFEVAEGVRLSCRGEDEARVFESLNPIALERLAALDLPATVACGGGDEAHAIPARLAPILAAALGNATLERHGDLSHFGPMENGGSIAASILAHCRRVDSGS